jgi:hypothetical protein
MSQVAKYLMLGGGVALSFFAQQPPRMNQIAPMSAQSASSVSLSAKGGEQTLEINNVVYEVTGDSVPSRPRGERILLRETMSARQVIGDIGQEAVTTLEAWPLGVDLKQKPLYTLKVPATGGQTVDGALFVAERGLEEVEWWSVYRLGTGQHLFDTHVPVLSFSISKDVMESRYVGLEVPPDDATDTRLKKPNVVAVITYASEERVKREALLTCDDPAQAAELRSYADTTRAVSVEDGKPTQAVNVAFRVNGASAKSPVGLTIPITSDDLDLSHAKLSPRLHLMAFNR